MPEVQPYIDYNDILSPVNPRMIVTPFRKTSGSIDFPNVIIPPGLTFHSIVVRYTPSSSGEVIADIKHKTYRMTDSGFSTYMTDDKYGTHVDDFWPEASYSYILPEVFQNVKQLDYATGTNPNWDVHTYSGYNSDIEGNEIYAAGAVYSRYGERKFNAFKKVSALTIDKIAK